MTPGGTVKYANSHGVTNVAVAFQGARNAGPTASGVTVAVPVRDEVVVAVCVRSGVPRGRHAAYAGALHSPGCSAPPTQQSQQGDAADVAHRPQSNSPAAAGLRDAEGEAVAVDADVPLLDALPVPVSEALALGDDVDDAVARGAADSNGSRVGVKDGEPTGCTHASVTWPWPPVWPAPGM